MTVRVTTLKGAAAGRYYTEHLPSSIHAHCDGLAEHVMQVGLEVLAEEGSVFVVVVEVLRGQDCR